MTKEPNSSSYIVHSHDSLFKTLMQDNKVALDFIEHHLSPEIKAICDLSSLKIEPTSFIESDLSYCLSDMLYSLNTKNGKGYIYCLIEQQSSPDNLIAFRLMHYAIMAINNHLKQGAKKLPLVIPMLFYSGKKSHPKSIPLDWYALFENPELAKKTYNNAFKIIDVTQIPDDELKTHNRLGVLEYLLKHVRTRDLINMINELIQSFVIDLFDKEQQKSILIYLLNQGKIDKQNIELFLDELVQKELGGDTMAMTTVADYLRKQGREQGMQMGKQQGFQLGKRQGIQLGEQRGLQTATITIARNMLRKGIAIEIVQETTGLSKEEIKKLQK